MRDIRRPDFLNAALTSRSHSSLREMFMAIVLFFLGSIVGSVVQLPAMFVYLLNNQEYREMVQAGRISTQKILNMIHELPDWMLALTLCASVGILIASIVYCRIIEKRKAYSMGFAKKSCLFFYLTGLLSGGFTLFVIYAVCVLFGSIQIDVTFREGVELPVLFLFFLGYMVQGMAEEALCRGFLLVSLTKRYTVSFSLLLSAVFYAFFCGLNSELSALSYLNLVLFGYLMGLLFLRFENIWLVGAFHGIWNFIQMNIFGSADAASGEGSALFSVTLAEGQDFVHGGKLGVEGGMVATTILLLGVVGVMLEMHQKGMFVTTQGPVVNPYDKVYYEEFQQFLKEKNRSIYEEYQQMSRGERPVETPVSEEMIREAAEHRATKKEEEDAIRQTEFDQNYFKS